MKSYDNKKIYNYKEKHKGKKRIKATQRWQKSGSSEYTKKKRQEYRCRCKEILKKQLRGQSIEFLLYRKTMWWDS
jgi:hypothetical protein